MKTLSEIYHEDSSLHELGHTGGGDKGTHHTYISQYERSLALYRDKNISLLEIGVAAGQSLKLWQQYFSKESIILGIDVNPNCSQYKKDNINVIINRADRAENYTGKMFDIIIDDGSHVLEDQINCFNLLFHTHLNTGGIYIIEDVLDLDRVQTTFKKLHTSCFVIDHRSLHEDVYNWDKNYRGWPSDITHAPPIGHDDVMIIFKNNER